MPESKWSNQQSYRMRLETEAEVAYRGESLVGRARIESTSAHPTIVARAGVWLWAVNLDDNGRHVQPHHEIVQGLEVLPGQTRIVPFSLDILNDTTLGPTYLSLSHGSQLTVPFRYPSLTLRVLPERRFVDLADVLARVSGHDVSYWSIAGGGDGVHAHLTPRPDMRPLFDGLGLELFPDGASVYGRLIVDPQERTLSDVLRAATLSDVRRYRLRFTATELLTAADEFERLLRPFMAADRHLPIPALGKARDELPRASQPPAPDPAGLPIAEAAVPPPKR